jgi:C-5 cytosine-specific DNA methylase
MATVTQGNPIQVAATKIISNSGNKKNLQYLSLWCRHEVYSFFDMADETTPKPAIRALEFFSGIGGLHYGLRYAMPSATVLQSFDINVVANLVYKHNFGHAPSTRGIDRLDAAYIDAFKANCWLLSPPCRIYNSQ